MNIVRLWFTSAAVFLSCAVSAPAADPVTFANLIAPDSNSSDEPFAKEFSLVKAAHFLDSASLEWQKSWQCFTCHTNISYLIARPSISAAAPLPGITQPDLCDGSWIAGFAKAFADELAQSAYSQVANFEEYLPSRIIQHRHLAQVSCEQSVATVAVGFLATAAQNRHSHRVRIGSPSEISGVTRRRRDHSVLFFHRC